MERLLGNMLGMLPVLGINAFERAQAKAQAGVASELLSVKGKGVSAQGFEGTQGFVVKEGSQAVVETVPSMEQYVRGMYELREELIR
ncbi:MAG: hypothetical protein U5L03_10000, partial [Burkholderiaceae bacterium]|nr:hypothetical protein [Burkholderiaceae bacterium]